MPGNRPSNQVGSSSSSRRVNVISGKQVFMSELLLITGKASSVLLTQLI